MTGLCRTCRWWSWHKKRAGVMTITTRYCISLSDGDGCHWRSRRFHANSLMRGMQSILDNACQCCIERRRCYLNADHTAPRCSKFTYEQKKAILAKVGYVVDWNPEPKDGHVEIGKEKVYPP